LLQLSECLAQSNYKKADSLYNSGNYKLASVYYEYCAYADTNKNASAFFLLKKIDCYLASKEYELGYKEIAHFGYNNVHDSLTSKARQYAAVLAYLNKKFDEALVQFKLFEFINFNTDEIKSMIFIKALCLNEQHKYDEAKKELTSWYEYLKLQSIDSLYYFNKINNLYGTAQIPKIKSIDRAVYLASFFPGFGHYYVGAINEGFINQLLIVSSITFAVVTAFYGYYVTAAVVGYGLFNRFHKGAVHRMDFLVKEKNYKLSREFNTKVKEFVFEIQEKI
jgi:hypothetical protein